MNCRLNDSMIGWPPIPHKTISDLSDDELLIVFTYLDLREQFLARRVCVRWRDLVSYALNGKQSVSLVNDTKQVVDWRYERWYEIRPPAPKHYTRAHFKCLNASLQTIVSYCPRLRDIDLECYDVNTQTLRVIGRRCAAIERLNFDSCNGVNIHFVNYLAQRFPGLRVLNMSCVAKVSEKCVTKLLQSLTQLVALNVCGTNITGQCLTRLPRTLCHLNISYCWQLEGQGLSALVSADCPALEELVVNNFNFDTHSVNECLAAICVKYPLLKRLEMALGPCSDPNFFFNTLNTYGLSSIARLSRLQTLVIRKICVLDDTSLRAILYGCQRLKTLAIDMLAETTVTDQSISCIPVCSALESLEISHNQQITAQTLIQMVTQLPQLSALSLRYTKANNSVVSTAIARCPRLHRLCVNGCKLVTKKSLVEFIGSAKLRPQTSFEFEAILSGISGTGIYNRNRSQIGDIPANVAFKVSAGRTRHYLWCESSRFDYSRNPKTI